LKFEQITKGKRAVRVIDLPLMSEPDPSGAPRTVRVALRVLTSAETTETVAFGLAYAQKHGSTAPKAGDPLYETGVRVKTLLLACLDPDNPDPDSEDARFFSSEEQIEASPEIGRDGIWLLYQLQEAWQDACSPQPAKMGLGEYYREVELLAKSDDPFYLERFRPALRASFARSMASQLWTLLASSLISGSSSEATTKTPPPKPGKGPRKSRKRTAKP
jgi:hypothetical protein